jgi:hypothetical protein
MGWGSGAMRIPRRKAYVRPNIEAMANKLAEQMVTKILEKLPMMQTAQAPNPNAPADLEALAAKMASQIMARMPVAGVRAASDGGPVAIAIDDKVLVTASSDITGIEKAANLQDTKTTTDSTLKASKEKLAKLKKG